MVFSFTLRSTTPCNVPPQPFSPFTRGDPAGVDPWDHGGAHNTGQGIYGFKLVWQKIAGRPAQKAARFPGSWDSQKGILRAISAQETLGPSRTSQAELYTGYCCVLPLQVSGSWMPTPSDIR